MELKKLSIDELKKEYSRNLQLVLNELSGNNEASWMEEADSFRAYAMAAFFDDAAIAMRSLAQSFEEREAEAFEEDTEEDTEEEEESSEFNEGITPERIAVLQRLIENLEKKEIPHRDGFLQNFLCIGDQVTFNRVNEDEETTRAYVVEFMEGEEIPPNYEWESDTNSGEGSFSRLPKEAKETIITLHKLSKELYAD